MIGRRHHVVIDCPDPSKLAAFYSELIGLPITYESEDWVVIAETDQTSGFAFQRAIDHQKPRWPDPRYPQQFHLDLLVDAMFAFLRDGYLRVDLAATLLDPRDVSPSRTTVNDLLPYQARLVVTPRVEGRVPIATRVVRLVKLAVTYFYEAARYADPAGLIVIPSQGSLDVDAEVALLNDHLAVRGRLSNLLDQTRVDFIGYPLPGRAGYASMEARW